MWTTVLISVIVLNTIMALIHVLGPKGIILTWVPGRTLILIASILHEDNLVQTLTYTWASGILPVAFLIPMHMGVYLLGFKGRSPRFECSWIWVVVWLFTIAILIGIVVLIGSTQSVALQLTIGIFAIFFNISNMTDAPQHIQEERVELTATYVIGTNIVIIGILALIHIAIDRGEVVWAGILSNIPLMAFILIAGSSCRATPQSLKMTAQHIYMLSYQTWPNMAFVGTLWAALPLGVTTACILASTVMVVTLIIQFIFIKNIL